jgi:hypothetical protein
VADRPFNTIGSIRSYRSNIVNWPINANGPNFAHRPDIADRSNNPIHTQRSHITARTFVADWPNFPEWSNITQRPQQSNQPDIAEQSYDTNRSNRLPNKWVPC